MSNDTKSIDFVNSCSVVKVNPILANTALITIIDFESIGFDCVRCFNLSNISTGIVCVNHAHKQCAQIFQCISGSITLSVLYPYKYTQLFKEYHLCNINRYLVVPPMHFLSAVTHDLHTIVNVFCDKKYDENDYIRSFQDYCDFYNDSRSLSDL